MNDQDRSEFARLHAEQLRLERELAAMRERIRTLEKRVEEGAAAAPIERLLAQRKANAAAAADQVVATAVPPPIPPIPPSTPSQPIPPISPARPGSAMSKPPLAPMGSTGVIAPSVAASAGASLEERSFELRLGTYWFVRVGIVMVLTALVFFGTYAYQNYIGKLGPVGKVSFMYAAGAILLAAGAWWQRRAVKESLRNYAQVLLAGGMAAIYFTTYAAHHFPNLRVIGSAGVDGALLLVWAGVMVWVADRLKSQALAFLAVGLAYYASVITRVGHFTLSSNLVLGVAGVLFLVRNRWSALTFASLAATYFSYSYWRFFNGSSWQWASPEEGLWSGVYFLGAYWVIFSAAVFLSRDESFAGETRTGFLTANNAAFFALFFLTMLQVQSGRFWQFLMAYGVVLLALAVAARRALPQELQARNAYLAQGLLLVTAGLITKFSGLHLALLLGAESVILLYLGLLLKNRVLRAGAYIAALLGTGWALDGMREFDAAGLYLGAAMGAMMIANVVLTHRQTQTETQILRFQPGYFTVLALAAWLAVTWNNSERANLSHLLAVQGLLLTGSVYLLRVREIPFLSQSFLLLSLLAWLLNIVASWQPSWWQGAVVGGTFLALTHWWQRQEALPVSTQGRFAWQWLYAFFAVILLYAWLHPQFERGTWLVVTSGVCLLLTAYAVLTRAWTLGATAQLFLLASTLEFAAQVTRNKPHWILALAPVGALGLLSWRTVMWFRVRPGNSAPLRNGLLQTAMVYRWVALLLLITWVCYYIPARERIWVLGLLGAAAFAWAGYARFAEALLFSAAFTGTALFFFWTKLFAGSVVYAPNLLVILALLVQAQVSAWLPERFMVPARVRHGAVLVGAVTLWLFVSRLVRDMAGGFLLTASWSGLALVLFTLGIVLRERMYRWVGLGVLVGALGRVVLFDVWKLETVYRILSFLALGIVLLVLGFVYSKYQEKIRQWL